MRSTNRGPVRKVVERVYNAAVLECGHVVTENKRKTDTRRCPECPRENKGESNAHRR